MLSREQLQRTSRLSHLSASSTLSETLPKTLSETLSETLSKALSLELSVVPAGDMTV